MQTNTIKTTSFYLFRNFLRITQEFHEDKAFIKMKSLTFERDYEFEYKDVCEISDSYITDGYRLNFSYWILLISTITLVIFCNFIYANPILLRIEQILYLTGLLLLITSFRKTWYISIMDKKNNFLTYIKLTPKNHDLIEQATEMVKTKADKIQEVTVTTPFPDEKPVFEHVEYRIPKLEIITDKFYDDKVAGLHKGVFEESAYIVSYSQLSGKIYRGKAGNNDWFSYLSVVLLIGFIITGFRFAFNINPSVNLSLFFSLLLVLAFISWLLSFRKREEIGFYDINENIVYWTRLNQKSKAKVEEIIKFVQSKIPAGEKGLKGQS